MRAGIDITTYMALMQVVVCIIIISKLSAIIVFKLTVIVGIASLEERFKFIHACIS